MPPEKTHDLSHSNDSEDKTATPLALALPARPDRPYLATMELQDFLTLLLVVLGAAGAGEVDDASFF